MHCCVSPPSLPPSPSFLSLSVESHTSWQYWTWLYKSQRSKFTGSSLGCGELREAPLYEARGQTASWVEEEIKSRKRKKKDLLVICSKVIHIETIICVTTGVKLCFSFSKSWNTLIWKENIASVFRNPHNYTNYSSFYKCTYKEYLRVSSSSMIAAWFPQR